MISGTAIDPPLWNRDEDLLAAVLADGRPRLRVVPWDRFEIVVGRGGNPAREVDLAAAAAAGIPVLRRRGGGCAVLLDPGNVVVSLVMPLAGVGRVTTAFRAITRWLAAGLAAAGCPGVAGRGVSDLVLGDRKVGGSCIYRTRGLLYYSTTLLVAPDLAMVERCLPHPPREPAYRAGRSHREFMGRLVCAGDPSPADLADRLRRHLRPSLLLASLNRSPTGTPRTGR